MQIQHRKGDETGSLYQHGLRLGRIGSSLLETWGRNSYRMRGTSNEGCRAHIPKPIRHSSRLLQQHAAPALLLSIPLVQVTRKHLQNPFSLRKRGEKKKKKPQTCFAAVYNSHLRRDSAACLLPWRCAPSRDSSCGRSRVVLCEAGASPRYCRSDTYLT